MNEPLLIKLEHPDEETARIFAAANTHPVRVECDGVVYRIEREDHWLYYHPEGMQGKTDEEHRERGQEDFRRIVREAKPKAKSLEWGPETRYGREDDYNNGYNEALDEYEGVLLKRLETNG